MHGVTGHCCFSRGQFQRLFSDSILTAAHLDKSRGGLICRVIPGRIRFWIKIITTCGGVDLNDE